MASLQATLIRWHRDVGYLAVGMVLIYAISGIAVNHRQHWDYNQSTSVRRLDVSGDATLSVSGDQDLQPTELAAQVARVVHRGAPRNAFWRGQDRFSLYYGEHNAIVVDYHPSTGVVVETVKSDRPIVRQFNALHLNEAKSWWTWVADIFALALIFLALSGMLMVKSRKYGLRGRGAWLVAAGVAVPALAWLVAG